MHDEISRLFRSGLQPPAYGLPPPAFPCHQRRTRTIGEWIANSVCHEVPHRQFVFTIPKVLRGIFRKRRHLLTLLFHTATATLQDAFRIRLGLPQGRIGAIAGVHTLPTQ